MNLYTRNRRLKVALPKGKVQGEVLSFLSSAGFRGAEALTDSRTLEAGDRNGGPTFLSARDRDIPTFVEHGVCEVGIVGKDVLIEQDPDVYEPLDLGLGKCRLVWAAPKDFNRHGPVGRVATKYPRLTARFFERRGETPLLVELYGSVELAPSLGLADSVVDLVSTGQTLRNNGLVEIETVREITTWVVVNRAASKLRSKEIGRLLRAFEAAL